MLPSAIKDVASRVNDALRDGSFASADLLILEFSAVARQQIASVLGDEQRWALRAEVLSQLNDWLHLARVLRSHISSALHAANAESKYLSYS